LGKNLVANQLEDSNKPYNLMIPMNLQKQGMKTPNLPTKPNHFMTGLKNKLELQQAHTSPLMKSC